MSKAVSYPHEDIDYTERFYLRVMSDEERLRLGLAPHFTWLYVCGEVEMYLTTKEASEFVLMIGEEVEDFRKKFSKKSCYPR